MVLAPFVEAKTVSDLIIKIIEVHTFVTNVVQGMDLI
jgi:hypothetical protein